MLNIGTSELIVIFLLALVLLGPRRLPELARQVGKVIFELRRTADDLKHTLEEEVREEERQRRLESLRAARTPAVGPPAGPSAPPTPSVSSTDLPEVSPPIAEIQPRPAVGTVPRAGEAPVEEAPHEETRAESA